MVDNFSIDLIFVYFRCDKVYLHTAGGARLRTSCAYWLLSIVFSYRNSIVAVLLFLIFVVFIVVLLSLYLFGHKTEVYKIYAYGITAKAVSETDRSDM